MHLARSVTLCHVTTFFTRRACQKRKTALANGTHVVDVDALVAVPAVRVPVTVGLPAAGTVCDRAAVAVPVALDEDARPAAAAGGAGLGVGAVLGIAPLLATTRISARAVRVREPGPNLVRTVFPPRGKADGRLGISCEVAILPGAPCGAKRRFGLSVFGGNTEGDRIRVQYRRQRRTNVRHPRTAGRNINATAPILQRDAGMVRRRGFGRQAVVHVMEPASPQQFWI